MFKFPQFLFMIFCLNLFWSFESYAWMRGAARGAFAGVTQGARSAFFLPSSFRSVTGAFSGISTGTRSLHNRPSRSSGLSKIEVGVVRQYTLDSSSAINSWLNEMGGVSEETTVEYLDQALAKLPIEQNPTLYRREYRNAAELSEYVQGAEITFKGYISASHKRFYGGNVYITFVNQKTGRDISHLSNYPAEEEVLFPRGTSFRVLDTQWKEGVLEVVLEEVEWIENRLNELRVGV